METVLKAAVEQLQCRGAEEQGAPPRRGSEVTITSEAGRARVEVLKGLVANAEEFLATEEAQGGEYSLLKKLELLKNNINTNVEKMESA